MPGVPVVAQPIFSRFIPTCLAVGETVICAGSPASSPLKRLLKGEGGAADRQSRRRLDVPEPDADDTHDAGEHRRGRDGQLEDGEERAADHAGERRLEALHRTMLGAAGCNRLQTLRASLSSTKL